MWTAGKWQKAGDFVGIGIDEATSGASEVFKSGACK